MRSPRTTVGTAGLPGRVTTLGRTSSSSSSSLQGCVPGIVASASQGFESSSLQGCVPGIVASASQGFESSCLQGCVPGIVASASQGPTGETAGGAGLGLRPHQPSLSSSKSSSLPQPLLPSWSALSTPPEPLGLSGPPLLRSGPRPSSSGSDSELPWLPEPPFSTDLSLPEGWALSPSSGTLFGVPPSFVSSSSV